MAETLRPGPEDVGVAASTPPTQETEKNPEQALREAVYAEMTERSVYPVKLIQGGTVIDLIANDSGAERNRPFMVFEVAVPDPDVESAIYKVRVEADPKQQARNEIIFFRELAGVLRAQMTPIMAQKIRLPNVYQSNDEGERPFLVEEKFEGEICGSFHEADASIMTEQVCRDLADFIKYYQQVATQTFQNRELPASIPRISATNEYRRLVGKWGSAIQENLGDEYLSGLLALIDQNQKMIESSPDIFLWGDVHPGNVIKCKDGSLGVFDFEKILAMKAPGQDYCCLYADLWVNPEMQARFLDYVLEINRDIPNFKQHLRVDYLSYRGVGELNYWTGRVREAQTDEEKEECIRALQAHIVAVKAAIEGSGQWVEETNA